MWPWAGVLSAVCRVQFALLIAVWPFDSLFPPDIACWFFQFLFSHMGSMWVHVACKSPHNSCSAKNIYEKERGNQLIQNVDNRFTPGFSWNKFLVVPWLAIYSRPGQFVTYSMLMSDMFHPFWHTCNSPLEKDFLPISHVTGVMMCRYYVCCMLCACLHY